MNKNNILTIGLDTHKEFFEVAYEEDGWDKQTVHYGRISSAKAAVVKLARQFQSKYPNSTLHFVYEAGPCGYWVYRLLTSLGYCCFVIAPSLIPKKPGDKVKTDRRDALKLAHLLKTNDLTPIYVPEPEDEAIRDLTRFDHPRKLMSYLGLTPSEHSSGDKRRMGAITKCGNKRARRLLVEDAHSYRFKANISTDIQKRHESLSKEIVDISWDA